jgi:hypothetical protein
LPPHQIHRRLRPRPERDFADPPHHHLQARAAGRHPHQLSPTPWPNLRRRGRWKGYIFIGMGGQLHLPPRPGYGGGPSPPPCPTTKQALRCPGGAFATATVWCSPPHRRAGYRVVYAMPARFTGAADRPGPSRSLWRAGLGGLRGFVAPSFPAGIPSAQQARQPHGARAEGRF